MSAHPKLALLCSSGKVRMNRDWQTRIETDQHLVFRERFDIGFNFSDHKIHPALAFWKVTGGTNIDLDNLLFEIRRLANVLSVEATVHVEEAPVVDCQLELPGLLPAAVEEDVAALETNLQRQTYLDHNSLSFCRGLYVG